MKVKLTMLLSVALLAMGLLGVDARADYFHLLCTIQSGYGLYYTTMAPAGNFIAMGDQRSPGAGIDIINIADPANLSLAGTIHTGHMTYALDYDGNYIYAPGSWDGFYIYDASDQQHIVQAAHMTLHNDPVCVVALRDSTALVGTELNGAGGNLYSIDIANPYNPQVVWSSDTLLGCQQIILGQSLAYLVSLYQQIMIVDISNPRSPVPVTVFACQGVSDLDVDEHRHLLYAACPSVGLKIYDIAYPASPVLLSQTELPEGWCLDVCHSKIYSDVVFISGYTSGLWAYDVSDPPHPFYTARCFESNVQCNYVMVYENLVFLTTYNALSALEYVRGSQDVSENGMAPKEISLHQNYPNPFNGGTTISFNLPNASNVKIEIFDTLGRRIHTLFDSYRAAGENAINWNASDCPSGSYFYKITSPSFASSRKMTVLK